MIHSMPLCVLLEAMAFLQRLSDSCFDGESERESTKDTFHAVIALYSRRYIDAATVKVVVAMSPILARFRLVQIDDRWRMNIHVLLVVQTF